MNTLLPLVSALSTVVMSLHVGAQGPIDAGPPRTTVVQIEPAKPAGPDAYLPAAPPSVLEELEFNKHQHVVVPKGGPGLPLPKSREVRPATATPQSGPGDFKYFLNRPVTPTGAGISTSLAEPAGANNRDTVLYTGNTFAALSKDSGMSWTYINPSTRFPAPDGPMCCDQRVIHVPSPNMTVWLLEYRYNASKGTGSLRIAFARGRDKLRQNSFASFVVNPKTFGFGNGFFLDYSDLAYGSTHLYGSAIVAPGGSTGSISYVLWRARLQDVYDGGGLTIWYYTGAQLGGVGNYRFAQGSTTTMYWAAHESTSKLRVYRWGESTGNAQTFRKTVSQWSSTPTPAPGPDNRDWTGFRWTNNCVLGGYANSSEVGFLWTSGSVSGRPRNFVRVARFRTSDLTLIAQRDVWSSAVAYHFPYAATNSRGHIGVTICFGGGTWYPSAGAFIIDDFTSWPALSTVYTMRSGKAGPPGNRWGDYFHCWRSSNQSTTWVGMGFTRQSATATAEPRYVWFGRERDQPTWVNLSVQSSPITGVPITVPQLDRFARGNGTTNFTRSYPPSQGYSLTAPSSRTVGTALYLFRRWRINGVQRTTSTTVEVSNIGSVADTAVADYDRTYLMSVQSRNPSSGVRIATSVSDTNGRTSVTTPSSLRYRSGQSFVLTAPSSSASGAFWRWNLNGLAQPVGRRTLTLFANRDHTARADYCVYNRGTFTSYGRGCPGTGNVTPVHTGSGLPDVGRPIAWTLSGARSSSPAILHIGLTKQNLDLGRFGAPGCYWYVNPIVLLVLSTSNLGTASVPLTLSADTGFIGAHLYTQYAVVDVGATTPLPVVHTNGIDMKIGGQVCR